MPRMSLSNLAVVLLPVALAAVYGGRTLGQADVGHVLSSRPGAGLGPDGVSPDPDSTVRSLSTTNRQTTAQGQTGSSTGQVFTGAVDLVRVDAYPRRDGRVVEGLTQDDFTVLEDGQRQTIDAFEFVRHAADPAYERRDPRNRAEAERWMEDPRRRLFVIYLDLYHTTLAASHEIRGPLMQVLAEVIGPSDVVAVMTSETATDDLAFAQTLNTVEAEIDRYWAYGLADVPIQPRTPQEVQLAGCAEGEGPAKFIERFRDDVFFTSLESLVVRLGAQRQVRTNVILLSEGWQTRRGGIDIQRVTSLPGQGRFPLGGQGGPSRGPGSQGAGQFGRPASDAIAARPRSCTELLIQLEVDYEERFRRLFELANAQNVTFHTIDVGGLRTGAPTASLRTEDFLRGRQTQWAANPGVLRRLAEQTDGLWTINANDITGPLRRVFDRTAVYYLLGYVSANATADGRYRRIEVRTRERGVEVTARHGYTAASVAADTTARSRRPSTTTPESVAKSIGALSRWETADGLATVAAVDSDGVHVAAELTPAEMATGRWRQGGDVRVELVHYDGRTLRGYDRIPPGMTAVEIMLPSEGDAGPWRGSVVVTGADAELFE